MNGYTLMHEHITIDLSGIKKDTDCQLDCYNETVAEFKKLYERGVRTVVDVTNDGMGRNVPYVLNVEKETGIRIIQSTGFYKEPFLPERVYDQTAEEMAAWMIGEIRDGIDGNGPKAGMIGEIGTSKNQMTEPSARSSMPPSLRRRRPASPSTPTPPWAPMPPSRPPISRLPVWI